jgi:CRISPR-associated protein Cmr5
MTRQQRWALRAHERVLATSKKSHKGEYRTLAMKMPTLIHQSGLVQALVFVKSRTGPAPEEFLTHLAEVYGSKNTTALIESAKNAELAAYMALTRDVTEASVWLRRFVQCEIPSEGAE